eukprot:Skav209009  [mRNA]  locus=scaffold2833:65011:65919:+ [translate_table: standard]
MASRRSVKKLALILACWFALSGLGLSFTEGTMRAKSKAGGFADSAKQLDLAGATPQNMQCMPAPPAKAAQEAGMMAIPGNPGIWVMKAGMRLFDHLSVMKDEIVKSQDLDRARKMVEGLSFDKFEEDSACIYYRGIPVVNSAVPEEHDLRYPYVKVITDICKQYKLHKETRNNLLNGYLAEDFGVLSQDVKFDTGKPGLFYYGKFMVHNMGGKIDFCLMFYKLNYKLKADVIEHTHAKKFLGFTYSTYKSYEDEEVSLSERDIGDFETYYRSRLFDLLGPQIKDLAIDEALDWGKAMEALNA